MNTSRRTRTKIILSLAAWLLCVTWALAMLARPSGPGAKAAQTSPQILLPEETRHLKNARQLTFGGQNAEAYFSADDKTLIFQHQGQGVPCDQIYSMPVGNAGDPPATPKLVSTGRGRTTCSYIFPSGDRILFSSTHAASADCPPKPD
jgi:hypothetical protein